VAVDTLMKAELDDTVHAQVAPVVTDSEALPPAPAMFNVVVDTE
jgi:hypothetical protein